MNERDPNREQSHEHLSDRLDFYKLTMGRVALERYPDTQVTFTLKNRRDTQPLGDFVAADDLRQRLETIREIGFQDEEIAYFAGLQAADGSARFSEAYLDFLSDLKLPEVNVNTDPATNELLVHTSGDWAAVSLWETVIMSEVSDLYYQQQRVADGLDHDAPYQEGKQRLQEKIAILKERPDIKFADFGTRRRYSRDWQEYVIEQLASELPDSFIGTSNPWFAYKFGLTPIGTYAHEMPMVHAALAQANGRSPLDGHNTMLQEWEATYHGDLSIALTDTFTTDFFFTDFTPEQARTWRGLRHDSGDPFEFGDRVIEFYRQLGIDPATKTIVFSDGLDINTIIKLADYFADRITLVYGWGTTLTNDLGVQPLNIVTKATEVNGIPTVKLSDDSGKHTGPQDQVDYYTQLKDERIRAQL